MEDKVQKADGHWHQPILSAELSGLLFICNLESSGKCSYKFLKVIKLKSRKLMFIIWMIPTPRWHLQYNHITI